MYNVKNEIQYVVFVVNDAHFTDAQTITQDHVYAKKAADRNCS